MGWWIWRAIVYSTFGMMAHQIYNIIYNKPKITKQVDEKGNVVTETAYPFIRIPLIFSLSNWIVNTTIGAVEV